MSRLARTPAWSLSAPLRTATFALGAQSALALGYLGLTDAGLAAPSMLAVPFVWITAAVVALRHADRPAGSRRGRLIGAVVGVGYALGLAWLTGAVGPSMGATAGVDVLLLPPGWGPALRYSGPGVALTLFPYRVVGVLSLGALVSLSVRGALENGLSAGVGGLVALGSCASCALPVVASIAGTLGGAGLGLGATPTVGGGTYLFGTVAYLLAVWLLAGGSIRRYSSR